MLHYIIQTIIFQLIFLVIYDLFHKKETYFNWNRLYLISTPILSIFFPFVKINFLKPSTPNIYISKIERVLNKSSENLENIGTLETGLHEINWWLTTYLFGVIISLTILALKIYKLKKFSLKNKSIDKKIIKIPNSNQAFTFWNTVYLGDALKGEERNRILTHEIVHVKHKHSLDQLFFEILKILYWWNPLVYVYQAKITLLHEYIADALSVKSLDKKNYMVQLLNMSFQTQEISFVNPFFNKSLIKKRIFMLQKKQSKNTSKFKYLVLVPVITGILAYTSCSDDNHETSSALSSTENKALTVSENSCLAKNDVYDLELDNYLKIKTAENVIANLINVETKKSIRNAYLKENGSYYLRNIPGAKYELHITYGSEYVEETINGVCSGFFQNVTKTEISEHIIDFNVLRTERGVDVPSYELELDSL